MVTANDVLREARQHIGYKSSSTHSKFNIWYGQDGYWCAIFVSYVAERVGATSIIPRHCYTPSGAAWFKNRGQWHSGAAGARPGDIVYFQFPRVSRINHVGIVEGWKNGKLVTIEGNTGDSSGRSGGCVMRKYRDTRWVVGYGRPAYARASGLIVPNGKPVILKVDGYWGGDTTYDLQIINGTPVDRVVSGQVTRPEACPAFRIGKGGSTLVRHMQTAFKVHPDGLWGPDTTGGAQRYYGTPVDNRLSPGGHSTVIRAMQIAINHQVEQMLKAV